MIFIANFKMMLTCPDVMTLINANISQYKKLAQSSTVIFCPPATALYGLKTMLSGTNLFLGAQTSACALSGAYTGDISPTDLAAGGVQYCLVGHSERRQLYHESNEQVATKATLLARLGVTPVICIGETATDRTAKKTTTILEEQLTPVLKALIAADQKQPIIIAYEPVWAIGTGVTPSGESLSELFLALNETMKKKFSSLSYKLLYGGSVSSKTVQNLSSVKGLEGLLIGGASLDFQEFKKIVDYFSCPASN